MTGPISGQMPCGHHRNTSSIQKTHVLERCLFVQGQAIFFSMCDRVVTGGFSCLSAEFKVRCDIVTGRSIRVSSTDIFSKWVLLRTSNIFISILETCIQVFDV